MKEKQGNNPNFYGKLMKRMLIYLGIGGVCGFFAGIFMTFGVKNGMSDLSDLVRPLALHCPDGILQPEIKGYDEASRRSRG